MAYVSVEADDRLEEGPQGLQFQSFGNTADVPPAGRADRSYLDEAPARQATSGTGGFWTVEYYQPYFDVDTKTVLKRCYTTLLPFTPGYRTLHLTPAPDLYGPFWTLSTLVFALFLSSSLASSITTYLSPTEDVTAYDFKLLSVAVTLVYLYGLGLPALLWLALRYIGVGEWALVDALAVWGYAQFVWIPIAVLNVIPISILRWTLTGLAFLLSGAFLSAHIYPVLASAEHKATRALIVLLAALHAALALTFKVLFFSYYVVAEIGPKDPLGGTGPEVTASVSASDVPASTLEPGTAAMTAAAAVATAAAVLLRR